MPDTSPKTEDLQRGLRGRHIQMIAIGGAIGVGLFLGSNLAIHIAGPGLLLAYLLGGMLVYIVMRALGEVAVAHPLSGSFAAYAAMYLGPRAGFITGWLYWFMWVVVGMLEITAVGIYCRFWWPELPQWIPAFAALVCMLAVNLGAVRLFGEVEFVFSLVKVLTILVMIAMGLGMIAFGFGRESEPLGIGNLYTLEGGFLPHGLTGVLLAMPIVVMSFLGTELIGLTAGEARNPERVIPSAINKVLLRILIFYVGAVGVIICIFPWNEIGDEGSPFVLVLRELGVGPAAAIINFVVITAALSSGNTGIFSCGRMLYTLSLHELAPRFFGHTNSSKVPARAILVSSCFIFIGIVLNIFLPDRVFAILASIASFTGVWMWATIIIIQMRSRRVTASADIAYPTFFYPWANYAALLALAAIAVALFLDPETRHSLYIGGGYVAGLFLAYSLFIARRRSTGGTD